MQYSGTVAHKLLMYEVVMLPLVVTNNKTVLTTLPQHLYLAQWIRTLLYLEQCGVHVTLCSLYTALQRLELASLS